MGEEDGDAICVEQTDNCSSESPLTTQHRSYKRWLLIAVYTIFSLEGQSVATILGRLYYDKGGNSHWMASLVQTAGFPILIPFSWYLSAYTDSKPENCTITNIDKDNNNPFVVAAIYVGLGILVAVDCLLYSLGLNYLPVSTYSLICSSQLAFNALFSFFLNSQKFTLYVVKSLVLLTMSSALLVFQNDSSESSSVSKGKYAVGFVCTVAASAGYGLVLSLTQLCFQKVLKEQTFKVVLDMIMYPALVATLIIAAALYVSGEAESMGAEMDKFEFGKMSYVMVLVWTTIHWQIFSIGTLGLIFEVSSLFSNAISVLGLPIVPIMAVVVFHDSMSGLKAISMVLAIWGFLLYVKQQHLDYQKSDKSIGSVQFQQQIYAHHA